jgi:hypothetical protein
MRRMMQQLDQVHVQVVERWQGVVERVGSKSFTARVVSGGAVASWPEEDGEFPLALVSDDDLELVQRGAFFTYIRQGWAAGGNPDTRITPHSVRRATRTKRYWGSACARKAVHLLGAEEDSAAM